MLECGWLLQYLQLLGCVWLLHSYYFSGSLLDCWCLVLWFPILLHDLCVCLTIVVAVTYFVATAVTAATSAAATTPAAPPPAPGMVQLVILDANDSLCLAKLALQAIVPVLQVCQVSLQPDMSCDAEYA